MGELQKRIRELLCTTEQYPAIEQDLPIIIIKEPDKILKIVGEMRKEYPTFHSLAEKRKSFSVTSLSIQWLAKKRHEWFVKWLAKGEE